MKRIKVILIAVFFIQIISAQQKFPNVVLETTYGKLVIQLYDNTPLHSQNFIKLVEEGFYNDILFHRVIKDFMIQAGDPDSKTAKPAQMLGKGGPGYTIPAEISANYYHKRGALAAARLADRINPKRESSGSQFYIVQGNKYTMETLEKMLQEGMHLPFTEEQINTYTTLGGSPHLDNEYTVFGEITEGLIVLDSISNVPVDRNSRPIADIKIIKAYTLKK